MKGGDDSVSLKLKLALETLNEPRFDLLARGSSYLRLHNSQQRPADAERWQRSSSNVVKIVQYQADARVITGERLGGICHLSLGRNGSISLLAHAALKVDLHWNHWVT